MLLSLEELLNLHVDTLRDSFSKAISLKRLNSTISDTIVAEDIGKMPDRNIAEALQRIPGVSIARSKGEGTFVTIRGIADNLNVTLINGQTIASAGDGRGIDFSSMPASMISAIEIYKTPKASDIEGSIGGTINIITSRPLDVGIEKGSLFVEYTHNNFNQENSPSISISYIKPVNTNFGIATAVSYEKIETRTDALINESWSDSETGFYPTRWEVSSEESERERSSLMLNLQWQPADNIDSYLDISYNKVKDVIAKHAFATWIPNGYNSIIPDSIVTNSSTNTMTEFAVDELYISPFDDNSESEIHTLTLQLGGEIELNKFVASAAIGYSEAETEQLTQRIHYIDHWTFNDDKHDAFFSQVGGGQYAYLPYVNGAAEEYYDPAIHQNHPDDAYIEGGSNNNINRLSLGPVIREPVENSDKDTSFKLDIEYLVGNNKFISSVETGFRWNKREKQTLSASQHLGPWQIAVNNATLWGQEPLFHDLLSSQYSPANFMGGEDGPGVPSAWNSVLDFDTAAAAYATHMNQGFDLSNDGSDPFFTDFESIYAIVGNTPDRRGAVDNIEESKAFYVQANLEMLNGDLLGNIGVRYIETELTSHALVGSSFDATTGGALAPITLEHDYDNILPSINLRYALNEDMYFRFAAAKVMARPNFNQAKAGAIANTDGWYDIGIDGFADPANNVFADEDSFLGGNVALDPYEANQFDISYEWYFSNSGLLSAGLFYKDINSFIFNEVQIGHILVPNYETEFGSREPYPTLGDVANGEVRHTDNNGNITDENGNDIVVEYPLLFETVQRPINGDGGYIKGLELAYQTNFHLISGLEDYGIAINYTYADSSAEYFKASFDNNSVDLPFQYLSEHTYNVTGYYEDDHLMIRVAYNWRSESLENPANDLDGMAIWRDSYGQLDTSFSYTVTEFMQLTASISNVLEESTEFFSAERIDGNLIKGDSVPEDRNYAQTYNGRVFRLGFRVIF